MKKLLLAVVVLGVLALFANELPAMMRYLKIERM